MLKIYQKPRNTHSRLVSAVVWHNSTIVSASDDCSLWRWDIRCEPVGALATLPSSPIALEAAPRIGTTTSTEEAQLAVGCADGVIRMLTSHGRIVKSIESAHEGAVTALRWSTDGQTIVSAGEDGDVKVWSRKGMHRATLVRSGRCVYSMAWAPSGEAIVFSSLRDIIVAPIQPTLKTTCWTAHDGPIIAIDCNTVNGLIASGGEDNKYKIWDSFGRLLYTSSVWDSPITAIAWRPDGTTLAVGAFNTLRLCDRAGWTIAQNTQMRTGSVYSFAWSADSTLLACGSGNGAVALAGIACSAYMDKQFSVQQVADNKVQIRSTPRGNSHSIAGKEDFGESDGEVLSFRGRVICMGVHLLSNINGRVVICTASQCAVHSLESHTTVYFDLKEVVCTLVLSSSRFLTVDTNGLHVYSYEGKSISNPHCKGLRPESLSSQHVALSHSHVALIARTLPKTINVYDVLSARPVGVVHTHSLAITHISLSQQIEGEQKIAFVDTNNDLHISPIMKMNHTKICSMVESVMWHPRYDMIVALSDGKLRMWFFPQAVSVDPSLAELACISKDVADTVGPHSTLTAFADDSVAVRRADGALVFVSIPSYAATLHSILAREKGDEQFDAAYRLCLFVKDPALWATFAGISLDNSRANFARFAFAEIENVEKVFFLSFRDVSVETVRSQLALLRNKPADAEQTLVQAGLVYRAVKLNVRMYNWERALEIAERYKRHIEYVIYKRNQYLEMWGKKETSAKFTKYAKVEINIEQAKAKVREEKENERSKAQRQR